MNRKKLKALKKLYKDIQVANSEYGLDFHGTDIQIRIESLLIDIRRAYIDELLKKLQRK